MTQTVRQPRTPSAALRDGACGTAADEDWRRDALCTHESPELFFPLGHSERAARQAEQAKRVCCRCSVREECLAWALRCGTVDGVFGGTDPDERRRLLRAR